MKTLVFVWVLALCAPLVGCAFGDDGCGVFQKRGVTGCKDIF